MGNGVEACLGLALSIDLVRHALKLLEKVVGFEFGA